MTQTPEAPQLVDAGQGDAIPEVGTLTCGKCGSMFVHEGRGRKPKQCPDCRRPSSSPAAAAKEEAPKRSRGIEALQKNIHQQLVMLGMGVAIFDTFDAQVIIKNAERGAQSLANLAATNPKIRAALESSVEGAGYLPVAMWVCGTALPILAHHGLIRGVPDPAGAPGPVSPGAGPGGFNLGAFHQSTGVPGG